MQVLVSPITTPDDDEGLHREFQAFKASLNGTQSGSASAVLRELNLGLGADWIVFAIDLALWTSAAVFIVPQTHKYVRESYEECKKMHAEVLGLIERVRGERKVVRYPPELLYLTALDTVLAKSVKNKVRFLSHSSLPVPQELTNGFMALQHYLFVFEVGSDLKLIAIDSDCQILWERTVAYEPTSSALK